MSRIAEGNSTDVPLAASAPEQETENKVSDAVELASPNYQPPAGQVQPTTQIVVVPNTVQQSSLAVNGSVMSNHNLNYFTARLEDTGNYEENMKPWETDGQNYSFACCTEKRAQSVVASANKKSVATATLDWVHSVYHKTGSTRLIIKRKAGSSALAQAKNNPVTKWAIFLFLSGLGVLIPGAMIISSAAEDDYDSDSYPSTTIVEDTDTDSDSDDNGVGAGAGMTAGGAVLMLVAIMLFCCYQKRKVLLQNYDLVTQSIPIKSIFYVERQVVQREQEDQCCCEKPVEQKEHHTDISIGYNRSNLSTHLKFGASSEDHITFSLDSNQAYNLHQYLNCIIDGSHPQTNGNVVMNSGGGDVLPRMSTFKPE